MSKTTENILLVPGETGWEIWTGTPAGFTLNSATDFLLPGQIPAFPNGDITLLFPVKSVTALPLRVTSQDDALFADLAALHAERLGLKPDLMAGQLTDVFVIDRSEEETTLLSVLLRSPADADLPSRGPKEFDLSARALPLPDSSLAIWKELGRWVFAISEKGKLAYCQATTISSASPNDDLIREIRLAFMQLTIQGIELNPAQIFLWSNDPETVGDLITVAFQIRPQVGPRPAPVMPEVHSKLLPADVRAARREALKRRNTLLGIAAVAAIYVGLIGWLSYGLWKESSDTTKLLKESEEAAPDAAAYQLHQEKWDELAQCIELANAPVDILLRISKCIPLNQGLRLKTADISAAEIKIIGEAPQPGPVNEFSKKLSQSNDLMAYKWQTPPANQSNTGWQFSFVANRPE